MYELWLKVRFVFLRAFKSLLVPNRLCYNVLGLYPTFLSPSHWSVVEKEGPGDFIWCSFRLSSRCVLKHTSSRLFLWTCYLGSASESWGPLYSSSSKIGLLLGMTHEGIECSCMTYHQFNCDSLSYTFRKSLIAWLPISVFWIPIVLSLVCVFKNGGRPRCFLSFSFLWAACRIRVGVTNYIQVLSHAQVQWNA